MRCKYRLLPFRNLLVGKRLSIGFCLLSLLMLFSCYTGNKKQQVVARDFQAIRDSGVIDVITLYSSTSYFLYKEQPMGYEYELLKDFADTYNLKVNVKIASNVTRLTEMLLNGEGDLIMYNIPITNELKNRVEYCGRETISHQVLVQRANRKDTILTDVVQLLGKEVWVKHDTKYYDRLVNLNKELGGGIVIRDIQKDTINTEDLTELVSLGKIPYTVSDDNTARLNKTYYSNLNIDLRLSHPQRSSWAVRKDTPQLAEALDQWFSANQNTVRYKAIMKRYFEMSKSPGEPVGELGKISGKGKISQFDELFKQHATMIHKDWRLLASIAYQESRFDTTGVSWAGAVGLMGLMPATAESMGVSAEERTLPGPSVYAAAKYFGKLERYFTGIQDEDNRIKFVLASYNAGIGHVLDARALARKYNKDPEVWEDVEEYIRLKSVPEYYNDSVCKHGYLRGSETAAYVRDVVRRWNYYREKVR